MQEQILNSFDYFLKKEELGKTDAKNVNQLLLMIDVNGYIEKQAVLTALFAKAKNQDANYRNFMKRVRDALANAQEAEEDAVGKEILESIEVKGIKSSKTRPARLQLTSSYTAPIVITPEANRQYDESRFQSNSAKDTEKPIKANAIRIFISYSKEDAKLVNDFKRLFEKKEPSILGRSVQIWTMQNLTFGETFDQQIEQNLNSADFGLAALSQNFLASTYIKEKEVSYLLDKKRLLLFGLDKKIDGKGSTVDDFFQQMHEKLPSGDLHEKTLQQQVCYLNDRAGDFFGDCVNEKASIDFVEKVINDLAIKVEKQQQEKKQEAKKQEAKKQEAKNLHQDGRESKYLKEYFEQSQAKPMEIKSASEELSDKNQQKPSNTECDLIEDMMAWANTKDSKQFIYAILGDYGMGKTFSCRIFSEKLAETAIKPFYIDLRDTQTFVTENNQVRQPHLEEIIDTVLTRQGKHINAKAQDFIQQAQEGTLIFIFDGLDEKLVHYNKDMRQQFLSELMRVFPAAVSRAQSKVKIVLSCRTHHFEDLKAQSAFLHGLGRSDSASVDYRAVEILPFNALQIESLLKKQLGDKESGIIFDIINSNDYLANLAKRPFLLTKIAQALPKLQTLSVVNSASVYQALIDDAIARDEGKHILHPRHKHQLLQDLSIALWQQSEQVLTIDELNEWYQDWLHQHPTILRQYSQVSNDELERDLRNSTLLVRFGEADFGFTHSSMQEFFLAQGLLKTWQQSAADFKLNKPISTLTRQFILDSVPLLKPKVLQQLGQSIGASLEQKNTGELVHLALDIIAVMSQQSSGAPDFGRVDLSGLKVAKLSVVGLKADVLIFNHSDLPASHWQDVKVDCVEIHQSNLNQSVWRRCAVQALHTDFNPEVGGVVRSGMYQLTLQDCQFEFEHQTLSKVLQWHIYANLHKLNKVAKLPLKQIDCLQVGHSDSVQSANFSPDGKTLISASNDRTLKLWDLSGQCLQTFKGHSDSVQSANFSPDGKTLISASNDRTLKLWDLNGQCLQTFKGHSKLVQSANFSPDGKTIISASYDGTLKLWDLSGQCLQTFKGHLSLVSSVNFSPDGKTIISASYDDTLKLWDLSGQCLQTFRERSDSANFSPDGKTIISVSYDGTLKLWDLSGQCLQTFKGHSDSVQSANFSPDGKTMISTSNGGILKLWDLSGQCLQTFKGYSGLVQSANFSPDGKTLIYTSNDQTFKLWDLNGQCLQTFKGYSNWIFSIDLSPDGKTLISTSNDGILKLWDLNGQCLQTFKEHSDWFLSANFSPDGKTLISALYDHTLKLWDLNGQCLQTFKGHSDLADNAIFSPDGKTLISTSYRTFKIWDLNGQCLQTFKGHSSMVRSANFSPNGKTLISTSNDNTLKLWDLNGQCLQTFKGHSDSVFSVNFSPNGKTLISASNDNTLKLWDLNGQCLQTFKGHSDSVFSVNFSPNGKTLISASNDNTLKLWDLNGQCLQTFKGHSDSVFSVNFSPNGKTLVSISNDGTLKLWDLNGQCLQTFKGHPNSVFSTNFGPDGKTLVSSGKEICLWRNNQLQQQWTNNYNLSIHNNEITKIKATATAWQSLNLSNGKQATSIDDFENFELFASH